MPFTLSHAIVAAPLHHISGQRLPLAALAIGAMSPDLHRLLTTSTSYVTHEWQSIFSVTLWIALGFCLLWYLLYRPFIYACLGLSDALNIKNSRDFFVFILLTSIAVVIGIATHLIWDGLTHDDFRTFILHDFLRSDVTVLNQSYPMHRVLQLASSVITLPFLIWLTLRYCQNHKTVTVPFNMKCYALLTFILASCIGGIFTWFYLAELSASDWQAMLYYHSGRSINEFFQGFLLIFTLSAIVFLFFTKNRQSFDKKL